MEVYQISKRVVYILLDSLILISLGELNNLSKYVEYYGHSIKIRRTCTFNINNQIKACSSAMPSALL